MASPQTTQDLLAAVLDLLAQYEVASQPSLPEEAREAFKSRVAYTLSYELPQAYLGILVSYPRQTD